MVIIFPTILIVSGLNQFDYLSVLSKNFFNLRLHRPIATTIFLLCFIFLTTKIFKSEFNKLSSFLLGLVLGLTLSSFYYFFIIQILTLILLFGLKYKLEIFNFIIKNFSNIIFLLIGFLLFALPFAINLYFHEPEHTERIGVFLLNKEKKIILLKYYLELIFSLKFLLFLFINFFILIINYYVDNKNKFFFVVPFVVFISSILAPVIFFIISNKSGLIYHFNNNIIICSFIFVIIGTINLYYKFIEHNKLVYFNSLIYLIFFIFVFTQSYIHVNKNYKNINLKNERNEFSNLMSLVSKKNLSQSSILTLDNNVMIWSIMNDIKTLKITNGLIVPKKNKIIEKEIIDAFNFFNISKEKFLVFLKNERQTWRYFNRNVANLFYARYQANRLKTYKDSKNFKKAELNKIMKSSPALNQQIIIPVNEMERLGKKFDQSNNLNYQEPDIIILNRKNFIYKNSNFDLENYCILFDGKFFISYTNKNCQQ